MVSPPKGYKADHSRFRLTGFTVAGGKSNNTLVSTVDLSLKLDILRGFYSGKIRVL